MIDIETKYRVLLDKKIKQRNNGLPYGKVIGPGIIISSILFLFVVPFGDIFLGYSNLSPNNLPILALIYFGIMIFSIFLPQYFSDNVRSTIRKTKRKYPKVHDAIFLYEYQLINEKMRNGMNPLIIDGKTYFIGHYSRFGIQKSQLKMVGYAVLNDKSEIIDDEEIFKQAFFTYNYGLIGSLSGQKSYYSDYRIFKEMKNVYVPRIGRYLKIWKGIFSKVGTTETYEKLLKKINVLCEVGNEILLFLANRERFRKAMGYSFAYELYYEDAKIEYELREAFYDFMMSKYYDDVEAIRIYSDSYLIDLKNIKGVFKHRLLKSRVLRIHNYSVKVINFLNKMKYQGIPSDDDFRAFKIKNTYIRNYILKNQDK